MNFFQGFKTAVTNSLRQMVFSGSGGSDPYSTYYLRNLFGEEGRDYAADAGELSETSIVSLCLDWRGKKFIEAPCVVQKLDDEGIWRAVPKHPLAKLLNAPNPGFTARRQWLATDASLGLAGNGYWIKVRSAAGKVVQIWWAPHYLVTPFWPGEGTTDIAGYLYRCNGRKFLLPREDVIHFRNGVDMTNWRMGKPPLRPHLKFICTDEQGGVYSESILRKMGVAGALFIPKAEYEITDTAAANITRRFREATTGANRGDSLVLDFPADVHFPDASPERLALDELLDTPEERIPGALGLNAMAVGLGAGLKRSTFSNMNQATRNAFDNGVAPLHGLACDELLLQLVPEFDDPATTRVWFDYSNVPSLAEDENELHKRADTDFTTGVLTQNEAREMLRRPPLKDGDKTIFQIKGAMATEMMAARTAGAVGKVESQETTQD